MLTVIVRRPCILLALAALALGGGCGKAATEGEVKGPPLPSPESLPVAGKPLPPGQPTSDPRVALQRSIAAYKALDSLCVTMEADTSYSFLRPPTVHQSTVLKYRKSPAGIMLQTLDGSNGTVRFFAGDGSLVIYFALNNHYARLTAEEKTLPALSRRVDEVAPQILSPLAFLQADKAERFFNTARMVGLDRVEGKPAYHLRGEFDRAYLSELGKRSYGEGLSPVRGTYNLWLDRDNYLIVKSSLSLAWNGSFKMDEDKPAISNPRIEALERTTQIIQNPAFAANEFRFFPPRNSQESAQ